MTIEIMSWWIHYCYIQYW